MKSPLAGALLSLATLPALSSGTCISSGDQTTINEAFKRGGRGTVVRLCENALIRITDQITFTADDQEISTHNYPTGSTRATIQVDPNSSAVTLIYGKNLSNIRIKNVQLDGNRPKAGFVKGGAANIEIGGLATGQVVSHITSRDPRGWSCLHIIGSPDDNQPCANAVVTHNDIGPAGESSRNSNGFGMWADGISLDCTDSLVEDNTIVGATDGGIVVFGSPGSTINRNVIRSSDKHVAFGGINMVDGTYEGSYGGVTVSNNVIISEKMINLGIGIGANVWSNNQKYRLRGPATIAGNKFSGNVAFSIAVNGWADGITVKDNQVTDVTAPKSSYSDPSHCSDAVLALWNKDANLVYYPAGVDGPQDLQAEFVAAAENVTNFLCVSLPLPDSVTFAPGKLNLASDTGPFADLHNAVAQYQGDSNVVVLEKHKVVWASGHTLSSGCGSPSQCKLTFGEDGNLATYYRGEVQWSTGTAGRGASMVVKNAAPWIEILDAGGNVIWDTTKK